MPNLYLHGLSQGDFDLTLRGLLGEGAAVREFDLCVCAFLASPANTYLTGQKIVERADLPVPETLIIRSHRGPYSVRFEDQPFAGLQGGLPDSAQLIVDDRVANLYADVLGRALGSQCVLRIEATEENKSLEKLPTYAAHLIECGIRRDHVLIAVGGGVIQDVTCFLAATLLRGVPWRFYPTTLLAQADSCIGSKSSINVLSYKNQLGTFTPPREVVISTALLNTLGEIEVRSGIGEMIKAHIIAGWDDTRAISRDYRRIAAEEAVMVHYIRRSLEIKKLKVEADEFDENVRLVMNYGHTFGHAIESATNYFIPHGIAVTIGMDIANFYSRRIGLIDDAVYNELHLLLAQNYRGFERPPIDLERFFAAILKDKKSREAGPSLVLVCGEPGRLSLGRYPDDERFRTACRDYFVRLAA